MAGLVRRFKFNKKAGRIFCPLFIFIFINLKISDKMPCFQKIKKYTYYHNRCTFYTVRISLFYAKVNKKLIISTNCLKIAP